MKVLEFISIDAWTIIFQICNLLILLLLVRKFLWKRVMAVLEARQQEIDGLYDATIQQLADMTHTPFARGKNLARTLIAHTPAELLSILTTLTSR